MGRPEKEESELQKHKVFVSLTDEENDPLEAYQKFLGLSSKAQVARSVFLEGLKVIIARLNSQDKP